MWFDNLPAVELARRLRQVPVFRFASVDELFRIAGIGTQVRHEVGRALFEEGSPAEEALLLLEGKLSLESRGGRRREIAPPALLGFQEVLEGAPHRETAHALSGTLSLSMPAGDLRTLLADNIELAQGLFHMLLDESAAPNGLPLVFPGVAPSAAGAASLKPIERGLLLYRIPLFGRATAAELNKLAAIAHEVPLALDSVLFKESDPPSLLVVLSGEIRLESGGEATVAGAGDAIGIYHVLVGVSAGKSAHVTKAGTALRIEGADLQGLLADDSELLQGIFSAMFRPESRPPATR